MVAKEAERVRELGTEDEVRDLGRMARRGEIERMAEEDKERLAKEDRELFGVLLHGRSPSVKRWMKNMEEKKNGWPQQQG